MTQADGEQLREAPTTRAREVQGAPGRLGCRLASRLGTPRPWRAEAHFYTCVTRLHSSSRQPRVGGALQTPPLRQIGECRRCAMGPTPSFLPPVCRHRRTRVGPRRSKGGGLVRRPCRRRELPAVGLAVQTAYGQEMGQPRLCAAPLIPMALPLTGSGGRLNCGRPRYH